MAVDWPRAVQGQPAILFQTVAARKNDDDNDGRTMTGQLRLGGDRENVSQGRVDPVDIIYIYLTSPYE